MNGGHPLTIRNSHYSKAMSVLLFVYGTLRQGHSNPMAVYLSQHAEYVTDGWFQGQLYQISFYPGAVASEQAHHSVYGEVYRLRDKAVLEVLDDYEECSPRHASPTEYQRISTRIQALDGAVLESVWIYVYQWPLEGKALIEGGDFMPLKLT